MRIFIAAIVISLTAIGCTKGPDSDPCARAVENARRLVESDDDARMRYGSEPITLARCRALAASREELACLGYASSVRELEACSPGALNTGVAGR
jgi:hypothetical protein